MTMRFMAAIARVIADEAADLTIASLSHAEICKTISPCTGCRYYCGDVSGGRMLVCGVHPHGVEGDSCPDYEAGGFVPPTREETQYIEAIENLENLTGIRADECDRRFRRFAARYPMHWLGCYELLQAQIEQGLLLTDSPRWECGDSWVNYKGIWAQRGYSDPVSPNPFNEIPAYRG